MKIQLPFVSLFFVRALPSLAQPLFLLQEIQVLQEEGLVSFLFFVVVSS